MKQKLVLFLGVSMMAFLLVGCKTEELEISSDVSEETSITAEADLTVEDTEESSENTLTSEEIESFEESVVPYPTEDVTPSAEDDFFTANNYTFKQYGYYEYLGNYHNYTESGYTEELQTLTGNMDYIVADNGDGTKTYTITNTTNIFKKDDSWGTGQFYFLIGDRYTGTVHAVDVTDGAISLTKEDGTVTDIVYTTSDVQIPDASGLPLITEIKVTVPADYDGLVLGRTGLSDADKLNIVWNTDMMANEALTGNSELLWWAFPE